MSKMQDPVEVEVMATVAMAPIEESVSTIGKVCVVCIAVVVIIAAVVLCILFSLGYTIANSQFWFGILGSVITAAIGYLFGANSSKA